MAYDNIFRTRVVEYVLKGHTLENAAITFGVGTTSIKRWRACFKVTGSTGGGYVVGNRKAKKIDPEELEAYMNEHPDAFLKEIAAKFSCCAESVRKALLRNDYTRKKRPMRTGSAMKKPGVPSLKQ
jgi:transposase